MTPSPIRCRGTWKLHKRSSEPDRWLDEMGFFRKHTARDSSCLFRAVSENVYNTQRYFHKVRLDCIKFMASKRHLFEGSMSCPFENYLKEMSNPSEWGGIVEITAMSHLYRRDFVIFEANKGPQTKICNGYGNTIFLYYSPETKHFDAVYTKEFITTSSFCQSLVYEILYDGVYHLKDLSYAVDKMLHDKVPTNHIEYFMSENVERRKKQKERAKIFVEAPSDDNKDKNTLALKCKHHTDDLEHASLLKESLSIFVFNRSLIQLENVCMNCLNVNSAKDLLDNGITPFPYKVAKALDPDIYRNIEFDVWSDIRRELRYGARYSDGTTLQVGVKCLCKLQADDAASYHCHIQEMSPDEGPCLVFIEELGEKRVVAYTQLEPLPMDEVRPWAPPYRYSRTNSQFLTLSQMLQQIGSISRKQGIGKTRKTKSLSEEPQKSPQKPTSPKLAPKLSWNEDATPTPEATDLQITQYTSPQANTVDFSAYQHLDFLNFETMPVEVQALPLMVDCRPAAGGARDLHNGAPDHPHQPARIGSSTEMAGPNGPGVTSPASVRASTPAAANAINTYTGVMTPGLGGQFAGVPLPPPPVPVAPCAPYMCGMKQVMWMPPHAPPPPPPTVNPHVYKSVQPSGADLPMNDIATLRFYFNLGVECMWAAYGPPPPPPPPPRHYSPRDLATDMQQISIHERPAMNHNGDSHKHKPNNQQDNKNQPKGNSQRPLLGPRFKRNGNQDGNQNNHNHQNKHNNNNNHNNNNGNKGPNNRRNSQSEVVRGMPVGVGAGGVGVGGVGAGYYWGAQEELVPVSYVPYPPPLYPPYYHEEPAMMGMMSGMGYMGYEETTEYVLPHYPPPAHPPHHPEHK